MLDAIEKMIVDGIDNSTNIDETVSEFVFFIVDLYKRENIDYCRTVIDAFLCIFKTDYKNNPELLACFVNRLANNLLNTDNQKVLSLYEDHVEVIKQWAGKTSLLYASVLYIMGVLRKYFKYDYDSVFECMEQSFNIRLKKLGRKDKLTNYALKELGKNYEKSFKLNRALLAYTTVIQNCNRNTSEEKEIVFWAMVHMANIFCINSKYEEAQGLLEQVLTEIRNVESEYSNALIAEVHHMKALVELDSGLFHNGEKNVLIAINKIDPGNIEALTRYKVTYILILDSLGKHEEAEENRTSLLQENSIDKEFEILIKFNELQIKGKNMGVNEYFSEMYSLVEEVNKTNNNFLQIRVYIQAINAWIRLEPTSYEELKNISNMLDALGRKITLTCGTESLLYAIYLYQKSLYYVLVQKYKEAYKSVKKSLQLQMRCTISGAHIDIYVSSMNIFSVCCMHLRKENEIAFMLEEAVQVIRKVIYESAQSTNNDSAYQYVKKANVFVSVFLNMFEKSVKTFLPKEQYNFLLNIRQPFDIFAVAKKKFLSEMDTKEILEINSKIAAAKMECVFKDKDNDITSLMGKQKDLLMRFSQDNTFATLHTYSFEEVAKNMPLNSCLVEFVEYSKLPTSELIFDALKYENDFKANYAVFVLTKDAIGKICIERLSDIEEHDDINTLVYITHHANDDEDEKTAFDILENIISEKLKPYVEKYDTMYLAPDGDLNKISFETLSMGDKYIGDCTTVIYVGTGRDVKKDSLIDIENASACIIGNPAFTLNLHGDVFDVFNWRESSGILCPLPASEIESERIHSIVGGKMFVGNDANKENFLKNANTTILHLCTHGYSEDTYEKQRDPLLTAGVYFAGYNNWLDDELIEEKYGNGFISAEEISLMDLSKNDMAVFSSCSSGLGTINFSDGIYGIRTALKLAGSKRCIVSIWRVNDFASAVFMNLFYRYLQDNEPSQALRKAKISLRNITVKELREDGWNESTVVERMGLSKPFIDDIFSKEDTYKPFDKKAFWGSFIYHLN